MIKKKIDIIGEKVQDVGYRLFLLNFAETIRLSMFDVENLLKKDDQKEKIEIYIGDDEQAKIGKFIEFVKTNFPKKAVIDNKDKDNITITDYDGDIKSIESFHRIFTAHQLYKFTNAGTEIITTQKNISN